MGLWINLSEASYSIANNTSVVNYAVYMSSNGSSWCMDGTSYLYGGSFGTYYVGFSKSTSAQLLLSGSTTIAHNADGTGSWYAYTWYHTTTSAYGNAFADASITLTTIPRASSMTASSSMITGEANTITINPKTTGFNHVLTVQYKNASDQWVDTDTLTAAADVNTISYTPSASLFTSDYSSTATRSGRLSLQTYNGSTAIGSAVTQEFTLTLQQTCKPSVPTITYSPSSVYTPTPGGTSYYLKNKSNITLNATSTMVVPSGTTPSGSIYKYIIDIGGQHLEPSPSSSLTNYTLPNPIDQSGSITLTVTAYDTRGRSTSNTSTIFTVYDYSEISASMAFQQNNDDVDLTITGRYYNFGTVNINSINQNATSIKYQIQGALGWQTIDGADITYTIGTGGNFTATASFEGDTHENVYIVQLFMKDDVGYPITALTPTYELVTGRTPISFLEGGTGISIGKEAEDDGFVISKDWTTNVECDANGSLNVKRLRNIFISSSDPTSADGENGDIWIKYDSAGGEAPPFTG